MENAYYIKKDILEFKLFCTKNKLSTTFHELSKVSLPKALTLKTAKITAKELKKHIKTFPPFLMDWNTVCVPLSGWQNPLK